jgi:hypothetical protein
VWIELVRGLYNEIEFASGAGEPDLKGVEAGLGLALPLDLKALLAEADGITVEDGLGLVWPTRRISAENLRMRSMRDGLYMPFDHLVFFGDAGNGDQFAFPVRDGSIRTSDVVVWNHEDDSRMWAAPDLRRYIEWWADGRIKT